MGKRILVILSVVFLSQSGSSQMIIRDIGDYVQVGLPLTGLALTALDRDKEGALQLVKSMAVQTGTTFLLKVAINRKRPNGKNYSFPSGHTSLAFMGSTFLWKRYGWKYGVPASLAAGFVAYSRAGIDDPVHHVSDVFAGAAIGIISSLLFTKNKNASVEVIGDTSFVGLKFQVNLATL